MNAIGGFARGLPPTSGIALRTTTPQGDLCLEGYPLRQKAVWGGGREGRAWLPKQLSSHLYHFGHARGTHKNDLLPPRTHPLSQVSPHPNPSTLPFFSFPSLNSKIGCRIPQQALELLNMRQIILVHSEISWSKKKLVSAPWIRAKSAPLSGYFVYLADIA